MAPVLHREAEFVQVQVALVSEKRLQKHRRQTYAATQGRLTDLWARHERGDITTTRLLRSCSHLNGPLFMLRDFRYRQLR